MQHQRTGRSIVGETCSVEFLLADRRHRRVREFSERFALSVRARNRAITSSRRGGNVDFSLVLALI